MQLYLCCVPHNIIIIFVHSLIEGYDFFILFHKRLLHLCEFFTETVKSEFFLSENPFYEFCHLFLHPRGTRCLGNFHSCWFDLLTRLIIHIRLGPGHILDVFLFGQPYTSLIICFQLKVKNIRCSVLFSILLMNLFEESRHEHPVYGQTKLSCLRLNGVYMPTVFTSINRIHIKILHCIFFCWIPALRDINKLFLVILFVNLCQSPYLMLKPISDFNDSFI